MASLFQISVSLHLLCLLISSSNASNQKPQPYIIYMGSASNGNYGADNEAAEFSHLQLLSTIIPSEESERISLIHCYNHAFRGFSALLYENEASTLSGHHEIVSIFPDQILQLHTTRSWEFLESEYVLRSSYQYGHLSSDVIIGMIDTGIWPESPSFSDEGIGEIPSRWKGICMEGSYLKKFSCNRKLIGARFYNTEPNNIVSKKPQGHGSARDSVGHGTHTTSIAAGAPVAKASYHGLAKGTARGGSPSARIAAYKACSLDGCSSSAILKAIDDAIMDGVDMISISSGVSSFLGPPDFLNDPIAIGAFHAQQMGVMVVCSAGNDGPDPFTVVNTAPWIFTVAASSIDRNFASTVVLGNGKTLQGSAISFSNLTRSKTYPLVFGEGAASKYTSIWEARNCNPGSLDPKKVAGKIVVCVDTDLKFPRKIKKLVVEDAKALGLILIDDVEKDVPFDSGVFPFTEVGNSAGSQILYYINSTRNPTAAILGTNEIGRFKPAPVVAYFSSRGPGALTENILKPDIMAPGISILGAMIPEGEESVGAGLKESWFGIKSGTSMACPHVSGAAAFIKSVHPSWSSPIIKSALMTTATVSNNMGKPMTNNSNYNANPHEMGVGEINPLKALDPGLVFETTTQEYLKFLCYHGYSQKIIKSMSRTNFTCPKESIHELISNLNYPSISIAKLTRHESPKTVERTVTNVGSTNATYVVSVGAPKGLVVRVFPRRMVFGGSMRMSFKVSFSDVNANKGYNFGTITWSNGLHLVRMVFAVNVE